MLSALIDQSFPNVCVTDSCGEWSGTSGIDLTGGITGQCKAVAQTYNEACSNAYRDTSDNCWKDFVGVGGKAEGSGSASGHVTGKLVFGDANCAGSEVCAGIGPITGNAVLKGRIIYKFVTYSFGWDFSHEFSPGGETCI